MAHGGRRLETADPGSGKKGDRMSDLDGTTPTGGVTWQGARGTTLGSGGARSEKTMIR